MNSGNEYLEMDGKTMSCWRALKSDLDRYRYNDNRTYFGMFIRSPGAMASVSYRLGHEIWKMKGPKWVVLPLKAAHILFNRFVEIVTGISIEPTAVIGPGLYIAHFGGIFIGGGVEMGSNCYVCQGVTIGVAMRGNIEGYPRLGDRVYVAPGAKLFGSIQVGDDSLVCANSVLIQSLPARSVAAGMPARMVSGQGSFEYIKYDRMDQDLERSASLGMRRMATA